MGCGGIEGGTLEVYERKSEQAAEEVLGALFGVKRANYLVGMTSYRQSWRVSAANTCPKGLRLLGLHLAHEINGSL